MNLEEATAYMAPKELDAYEIEYVRLLVEGLVMGTEKVLYGRCYLEVEDMYLTQLIPDEFQVLRWGDVDPQPITLLDFLLLKPEKIEGGTTSMITLCSRDQSGSMKLPMPAWRIGAWVHAVVPFGYSVDDILDQDGKDERMPDVEVA